MKWLVDSSLQRSKFNDNQLLNSTQVRMQHLIGIVEYNVVKQRKWKGSFLISSSFFIIFYQRGGGSLFLSPNPHTPSYQASWPCFLLFSENFHGRGYFLRPLSGARLLTIQVFTHIYDYIMCKYSILVIL